MVVGARRRVAEVLVEAGAVECRTRPPFRFTSGAESPIYVDNRRLLGFPALRSEVAAELARAVAGLAAGAEFAVAGTATAGIPWASFVASELRVPMMYVRSGRKAWGHERVIEGYAPPGAEVVVIEDLLFSGQSMLATIRELRAAGWTVAGAVAIVSYETSTAGAALAGERVPTRSLTSTDEAASAAHSLGKLSAEDLETVLAWLRDVRG